MKIDMSAKAVTNRLKTVNQLRKTCLSLANSSAGKRIREQFSANRVVQYLQEKGLIENAQ